LEELQDVFAGGAGPVRDEAVPDEAEDAEEFVGAFRGELDGGRGGL
jgi:hypothetical protein